MTIVELAAQTLDIHLNEIREDIKLSSHTCPAISARPTTRSACRARYSIRAYSLWSLNLVSSSLHAFRAGINFEVGHRDRLRVQGLSRRKSARVRASSS